MEENITSNKPEENTLNKRYNYIVAIDFGTYSTSFSFVHVDYENEIQTIKYWEATDSNSPPGRVASSVIYKEKDSVPLWGNSANKRYYNENSDFFYTSHVKLYLTDAENQPALPENLTPLKLASDYLKQLHEYGVQQMKIHFQKKNEENEVESVCIAVKNTHVSDHDTPVNTDDNKPIFNVTEDQIRYIISYPDNQNDSYITKLKEALKIAGVISDEDPEHRLRFVPASEATAHFCSNIASFPLKPSKKPYLVCDIGGEVLGLSAIHVEELPETGKVNSEIDHAVIGCGNLELDKNMRAYLAENITASEEDHANLEKIRRDLFTFYIDEIKTSFTEEPSGDYFHSLLGIKNTKIKSDLLDEETFVFSYKDMKDKVFDPVTKNILENIAAQIKRFGNAISGIFLSGAIGEREYLKNLVRDRFGTIDVRIHSLEDSAFAVSEGLIYSGIRERGLMIPYYKEKVVKQTQRVLSLGNETHESAPAGFSGLQKINHKDLDYIIGLDFGTTFSGFAYSPVPKNDQEAAQSHTITIKEIKAWPKQTNGNYPKVPSMLYYNQKMEYLNKFGHEAKAESTKYKAKGVLLRHFKLLLSRDFIPEVDDKILKKLDDFDIVGAIANFLKDFNKEGISRMSRSGAKFDEHRLGYVVTIPAMWSDEAKNTMKAAVKKAGLVKSKKKDDNIDDRLVFITEAEASALYCEKYYKDEFSMDRQQRFMICDAGGGTVDLVTFEVGQEEGADGKFLISEITSGDGDNCGSVYLDENFKDYIVKKIATIGVVYTEKGIDNLLEQFIREIKPNFEPSLDPDMEEEIRLQIPMSLGLPANFDDPTGFIQDNEMTIPYSDIENIIFKPVVDKVLNLIDKQLRKLPEGERQLDAILVVGGFGQSLYLHQKIIDKFQNKAVGAVFIGKPPNGDLAICRGAVSFGLEPRMVSEGITRYTYGLQTKDIYKEQDDPAQKIVGYQEKEYCQNVFTEIVARETKISKGTVYILKTFVVYPNNPIFAIYSVDEKNGDKDLRKILTTSNIEPICKLQTKMPEIPNIKEGDKVEFEIMVEITGTNINVDVLYDGKLLSEKVVTKANTVISKRKYELGSKGETKKKKIFGVSIFSLSS